MKIIALNPKTGLYFNGTNFTGKTPQDAIALHPGTKAEDFRFAWACPVEIVKFEDDPYEAARKHVYDAFPKRRFLVINGAGRALFRVCYIPEGNLPVYVHHNGRDVPVLFKNGQLHLDV